MTKKTVKVGSTVGLHARPASVIANAAAEFDDEILLVTAQEEDGVDASSALMIMSLDAKLGDEVTIVSDSEEGVNKIAELIESNLDDN